MNERIISQRITIGKIPIPLFDKLYAVDEVLDEHGSLIVYASIIDCKTDKKKRVYELLRRMM